MKKALIISVVLAILFFLLIYSLTNKEIEPFQYNEADYIEIEDTSTFEDWKERIRNNRIWMESIIERAKERNISVEKTITISARYMIDDDAKTDRTLIEYWVKRIQKDKAWMQSVKKGAIKKNITVEESILRAARYMVSQEPPK